jgi:hypothetical protein
MMRRRSITDRSGGQLRASNRGFVVCRHGARSRRAGRGGRSPRSGWAGTSESGSLPGVLCGVSRRPRRGGRCLPAQSAIGSAGSPSAGECPRSSATPGSAGALRPRPPAHRRRPRLLGAPVRVGGPGSGALVDAARHGVERAPIPGDAPAVARRAGQRLDPLTLCDPLTLPGVGFNALRRPRAALRRMRRARR